MHAHALSAEESGQSKGFIECIYWAHLAAEEGENRRLLLVIGNNRFVVMEGLLM